MIGIVLSRSIGNKRYIKYKFRYILHVRQGEENFTQPTINKISNYIIKSVINSDY